MPFEDVKSEYIPLSSDAEGHLTGGFGSVTYGDGGITVLADNNCSCGLSNNCDCHGTKSASNPRNNCNCEFDKDGDSKYQPSVNNCECKSNNCNCPTVPSTKATGSSSVVFPMTF